MDLPYGHIAIENSLAPGIWDVPQCTATAWVLREKERAAMLFTITPEQGMPQNPGCARKSFLELPHEMRPQHWFA